MTIHHIKKYDEISHAQVQFYLQFQFYVQLKVFFFCPFSSTLTYSSGTYNMDRKM